jgi:hypothetical protein
MATPTQYACFKDIYDREVSRHDRLITRGQLYLSIVTLYLGVLSVSVDKLSFVATQGTVPLAFLIASLLCFVASLLLVIGAIGIYTYVYPTDPEAVLTRSGPDPPTDEAFLDGRIVELSTAFTTNRKVNDRRARLLYYASAGLGAGVFFQVFVISSVLLKW